MEVVQPPIPYKTHGKFSIFLAGSIEGDDTAVHWQEKIIDGLSNEDVLILNPRRDSWDSSWKQEIGNPQFKEQVDWELDGLEAADMIVLYFDANTKSPISLLELGLFANSNKIIVCCPEGFWRKGNVDIVCERYGILQCDSIKELVQNVIKIKGEFSIAKS